MLVFLPDCCRAAVCKLSAAAFRGTLLFVCITFRGVTAPIDERICLVVADWCFFFFDAPPLAMPCDVTLAFSNWTISKFDSARLLAPLAMLENTSPTLPVGIVNY